MTGVRTKILFIITNALAFTAPACVPGMRGMSFSSSATSTAGEASGDDGRAAAPGTVRHAKSNPGWERLNLSTIVSIPMPEAFTTLAVGDLNNDGKDDVVANSGYEATKGVYVALNQGDGTFAEPSVYPTRDAGPALALGHFRKGKPLDIVAGDNYQQISMLTAKSRGTFALPKEVKLPASNSAALALSQLFNAKVADLNHDGIDDVTIDASDVLEVMFGLPEGGLGRGRQLYNRAARAYAIGDLDGDGYPEIVVAKRAWQGSPDLIEVMPNNNGVIDDAHRETYELGTKEETAESMAIADLNGDGKSDVVLTVDGNNENYVQILMNQGDGKLDDPVKYGVSGPKFFGPVVVADVNGDRVLDLVSYQSFNSDYGNVMILPGTGKGKFSKSPIQIQMGFLGGPQAQGLAVGDFLGNGLRGVAVVNAGEDGHRKIEVLMVSKK
jgi:FG-GAP-like repeat